MIYRYAPASRSLALALDPADDRDRSSLQLYHFVASLADLKVLACSRSSAAAAAARRTSSGASGPWPSPALDVSAAAAGVLPSGAPGRGTVVPGRLRPTAALPAGRPVRRRCECRIVACCRSLSAFLARSTGCRGRADSSRGDLRKLADVTAWRTQFSNSRMNIVSETDITPNVLASLDADSDRKSAIIHQHIPRALILPFSEFAGVRGSLSCERFRSGEMTYRAFRLNKPG